MNTSPEDNPRRTKSWIPMVLIACVAIAAGVFAGTLKIGGEEKLVDEKQIGDEKQVATNNDKALTAIQDQLKNTLLFPNNFKRVPAFSLLQGNNEPLTEENLKGKWTVLFFGFTNCPDICPITLAEMNGAVATLAEQSVEIPQVIFITVDPVRDTLEKMSEYVAYFNEDFIGGSGELTDITVLTRSLGVVASYTASESGDNNYSVDHTASMLVIDPDLRVRAKLNAPHKADTLAADLKTLMTQFN